MPVATSKTGHQTAPPQDMSKFLIALCALCSAFGVLSMLIVCVVLSVILMRLIQGQKQPSQNLTDDAHMYS